MAQANGSAVVAEANRRRPFGSGSAVEAYSGQARSSGGGSATAGHARGISSCPVWCGYPVNGVVEWCGPGCREFGEWGRDA